MKPYGTKPQHPSNIPDNHPPKGYVNWWEVENVKVKSKKYERQLAEKQIRYELQDAQNDWTDPEPFQDDLDFYDMSDDWELDYDGDDDCEGQWIFIKQDPNSCYKI